ncbi:MAG: ATP-binding cassette domain-containing protein [Myxococcota bacterium]|nr:ATP-binding cassette domain-containing protein [Myxococcota bacterium]
MATHLLQATSGTLRIGRAHENDHVIDHPLVSKHHARLTAEGDGYLLEDLESANGTFVNGEKITAPVKIGRGDTFQIGPTRMRLAPDGQVESDDLRLATRIDVQDICYDVRGGKLRLLEDISFTIKPGEFVALMGPAGAGKTTLMENINGNMTPSKGCVLVNGLDLHRHFDAMRGHIGYVPQDDIIHRNLTVYEACYYTAKMRMKGIGETELHDRVVQVLTELDIAHRANTIIGGPEARVLSGGQRKRVNLAMELVTDPAILFLDEPTSGLSSSDAKSVMQVLKALTQKGRTIIITIHQPSKEIYEMMDNALILGVGGRLIYYGSVGDAYRRFNTAADPDSLFEALTPKNMSEQDWQRMQAEFKRTDWYRDYVLGRATTPPDPGIRTMKARASRAPGIGQFLLLFERMAKLYTRDKGWLIGALVLAPALMFLLATVLEGPDNRHSLLFVSSLLAFFFGIFPSIDMVIGERTIYERERMVNLKIPSYLLSKVMFLAAFGVFQAFSMAAILVGYAEADAPLASVFFLLLSVQLSGVGFGLFVSSVAKSSKVALMSMLGIIVLMLAFSGFLVKLPSLRDSGTAWILGPSAMRWGLGGLMALVNDVPSWAIEKFGFGDEAWHLNVLVNWALSIFPLALTMLLLKVRDRV